MHFQFLFILHHSFSCLTIATFNLSWILIIIISVYLMPLFCFFIPYISDPFPVCKLCLSIFTIFTFIYFEIHPFSCLIIFLYSNLKFTLIYFSVQLSSHLILISFFCTFSSILGVWRFMSIHHDNYHFILFIFTFNLLWPCFLFIFQRACEEISQNLGKKSKITAVKTLKKVKGECRRSNL